MGAQHWCMSLENHPLLCNACLEVVDLAGTTSEEDAAPPAAQGSRTTGPARYLQMLRSHFLHTPHRPEAYHACLPGLGF